MPGFSAYIPTVPLGPRSETLASMSSRASDSGDDDMATAWAIPSEGGVLSIALDENLQDEWATVADDVCDGHNDVELADQDFDMVSAWGGGDDANMAAHAALEPAQLGELAIATLPQEGPRLRYSFPPPRERSQADRFLLTTRMRELKARRRRMETEGSSLEQCAKLLLY